MPGRFTLITAAILAVLTLACSQGDDQAAAPSQAPSSTGPDAAVLVVGPGGDFDTISAAVAAAAEGSTIAVRAGTYREQVEIAVPLTIEAYGDGPAVIDGECQRDHGIWIPAGSGAVLRGLEVRDTVQAAVLIGYGPPEVPPPERVTVQSLTISGFNCREGEDHSSAGVAVWYAGCCMTVRDNVITYREDGDPRGRGNGIWFKSNEEVPSGGGHTISGNVIRGGWDGIGGETERDLRGSFDRDSVIENNRVSDCLDDGIQAEGGNLNVRVVRNTVSGCATGIAFAPTLIGPLYVERNVITDLREGIYNNQFCFKAGYEGDGAIYLTENFCATAGDGLMQTNDGTSPIISRRNCIRVTGEVISLGDVRGMDFAEDVLSTSTSDTFASWGEGEFGSLRELQTATGQETDAVESADCPYHADGAPGGP